jgi:hypothetical protein
MSGTLKLGATGGQILFSTSGTSGFATTSGYGSLYYGSDFQLRIKDPSGNITILGAGGTGSGSSGTSGSSGISGSSGSSGNSGSSGSSGISGSSGSSGNSGSSGSSGSSGNTGSPGSSGTSGTSGGGSTTINNNASSRIITGSDTPNTLNGESNLSFSTATNTLVVNGIAIGRGSGNFLDNLAIGANTPLGGVTTGERNLAIGKSAGDSLTSGQDNTFIALVSGNKITTGNTNTCIGNYTLNNATGASSNCLIGYGNLEAATGTNVNNNTVCGVSSLYSLPNGSFNTVLGCDNGNNLTSGASNNNTIVGARINTGGTSVSDSIFIGDGNGTVRLKFDNTGQLSLTGPTVSSSTTNTVTNKIAITINGTLYYLLASTSGA